jgi:hypothetical protein
VEGVKVKISAIIAKDLPVHGPATSLSEKRLAGSHRNRGIGEPHSSLVLHTLYAQIGPPNLFLYCANKRLKSAKHSPAPPDPIYATMVAIDSIIKKNTFSLLTFIQPCIVIYR